MTKELGGIPAPATLIWIKNQGGQEVKSMAVHRGVHYRYPMMMAAESRCAVFDLERLYNML